jgi:DNA-binding response OmpR family regulator
MTGTAEQSANTATILVVDAEVLVRFAIADYLRECGYRVIEAVSGEEAALVIEMPDVKISILLCDAALEGKINAFSLARLIRRQMPTITVILAGTPAQASQAAAALCDDGPNLARPYEPQLVLDRIKCLIAKRDSGKP